MESFAETPFLSFCDGSAHSLIGLLLLVGLYTTRRLVAVKYWSTLLWVIPQSLTTLSLRKSFKETKTPLSISCVILYCISATDCGLPLKDLIKLFVEPTAILRNCSLLFISVWNLCVEIVPRGLETNRSLPTFTGSNRGEERWGAGSSRIDSSFFVNVTVVFN